MGATNFYTRYEVLRTLTWEKVRLKKFPKTLWKSQLSTKWNVIKFSCFFPGHEMKSPSKYKRQIFCKELMSCDLCSGGFFHHLRRGTKEPQEYPKKAWGDKNRRVVRKIYLCDMVHSPTPSLHSHQILHHVPGKGDKKSLGSVLHST